MMMLEAGHVHGFTPIFNRTQSSSFRDGNAIDYSRNFNKCWNTSPLMSVDVLENASSAILKNITSEIPDDFYCERVVLWKSYRISPYFTNYLGATVFGMFTMGENESGEYELCGRVRKWEETLHIGCESMLCDYKEHVDFLPDYVKRVTNGETSIFDWMNYCKYCKDGNSTYECNPKDDYTRLLVSTFPTSGLYCGTLGFGIPIAVNTSDVPLLIHGSTHFNVGSDFNYICYCVDSFNGYFSFKCSNNRNNFMVQTVTKYIIVVLHGLAIVFIALLLVVPKIVMSIRKSRYNFFLPSVACLLGETMTFIALILSETSLSEFTILVMDYVSLSFAAVAIYSWLFNWLRLVLLLKNGEEPKFLRWVHFLVIFACLSCSMGAILSHTLANFEYTFLLIYSLIAVVTIISFGSLTIFVFRTMKKFSDVNVLKTSLVHYLIFISAFIAVVPITKVIEIAFIFTSLAECLRYLFLLILFISVAIMDSNREELFDSYKRLWSMLTRDKQSKSTLASVNLSEPFLTSDSGYTEMAVSTAEASNSSTQAN